MPNNVKFLKILLSNKKRLEEEVVNLPHQVSAFLVGKI